MIADITYLAGASCRIVLPGRPVVKFLGNKVKTIKDAEVIKRCQETAGFSVSVRKPPKKKVKKPVGTKKASTKKADKRSPDKSSPTY